MSAQKDFYAARDRFATMSGAEACSACGAGVRGGHRGAGGGAGAAAGAVDGGSASPAKLNPPTPKTLKPQVCEAAIAELQEEQALLQALSEEEREASNSAGSKPQKRKP